MSEVKQRDIPELSDALGETLYSLRLNGLMYANSELSAPWGVAMPPMATALCFKQIATRRLNILAKNGVVLISTPNRSGHTELGSFITNSNILALKSHRAAFNPAP